MILFLIVWCFKWGLLLTTAIASSLRTHNIMYWLTLATVSLEDIYTMITCMITISMSQTAMDKFIALDDTTVNQESSIESAEIHSFWPGC